MSFIKQILHLLGGLSLTRRDLFEEIRLLGRLRSFLIPIAIFVLILWPCFAAVFSDEALSKGVVIGLADSSGYTAPSRFPLLDPVPVFTADKPEELVKRVVDGHHLTLRELITDAALTNVARAEFKKPRFMFSDATADPSALLFGERKWLRVVDGIHYYLPSMPSGFLIVELRSLAVPRLMN